MVARKVSWETYLRHHVYLPQDRIEEWVRYELWLPTLNLDIVEWLDENVGTTNASPWHRNRFYPKKTKWQFEHRQLPLSARLTLIPYECCVKFLDEEDALAFSLRWL